MSSSMISLARVVANASVAGDPASWWYSASFATAPSMLARTRSAKSFARARYAVDGVPSVLGGIARRRSEPVGEGSSEGSIAPPPGAAQADPSRRRARVDARREIRAKTSPNASAGLARGGETDDESKTLTVHKPERRARQLFSRIKRSAVSNFLEIKNLPTDAEGKKRIGANRPSVIRPPMIARSPPPHLLICHREAPEKCHTGLGKRAGTFGHGHAVRGLEPSSHTAPRASNATTTMALTLPFLSFSGIKLVPVRCARAEIAGTRAGPARDLLPRAPRPVPVSSPRGRANSRKKYPPPPSHPLSQRRRP